MPVAANCCAVAGGGALLILALLLLRMNLLLLLLLLMQPVMRQPASKERSRVRSNHMGSSRQGESVCSDNSASSIDNPNASVAAGAVYGAELGPDADGVSLLLHMGINAGRSGAAQTKVVQPAASAGNNTSASAAPSGISGQATARSAAALLMSLSGSHG